VSKGTRVDEGLHLVVFDDTTRINLWLGGEEYTPREGPAAKEPKG